MGKPAYRIAILGGGPSGLFMYKRLIESGRSDLVITIFEKKEQLGAGMPYSYEGANEEHVTNVSDNEIPELVTSINEWITTVPSETLAHFRINPENFSEYKVLPRLLFGQYLAAQFELFRKQAEKSGIETIVSYNSKVTDMTDHPETNEVWVDVEEKGTFRFDHAIMCTGHHWPKTHEGKVPGYFDAPYPPVKLKMKVNHPVAIKGSSLTAIDAIRTLARNNGEFSEAADGKLLFKPSAESADFRLHLHSRNGLLPAVRFHLDDSHLTSDSLLTPEQIEQNRKENGGFLSLDFVFEKNFKELFIGKDPDFYARIKGMTLEEFVDSMMELRERVEPFHLLRAEFVEAEKSIRRHQSIYWKEMLAVLSFAMNYPAKYFSAEDMQRLQKELMPLIAIVIAFIPQSSCRELLALNDAGILDIVAVGHDSTIEPGDEGGIVYHYTDESGEKQSVSYETFVDCVGQPHLSYEAFPFKSLMQQKAISPARLKFKSQEEGSSALTNGRKDIERDDNGDYYLKVPGITINDNFHIVDQYGAYNKRIFIMAVPYIGGYNPDYSGLDFCDAASKRIADSIFGEKED